MYQGKFYSRESFELFSLVQCRGTSMHRLHSQDLIIALLVIEHGGCEVVEYVLGRKWSISLNPLMPDEESVTVVIRWMQIVKLHYGQAVRSSETNKRIKRRQIILICILVIGANSLAHDGA